MSTAHTASHASTANTAPITAPSHTTYTHFAQVLAQHAAKQAQATFVISPDTGLSITYGQLVQQTQQLAAYYQSLGLKPGAHIGLMAQNGLQTLVLFTATICAGYVIAPMNLLSQGQSLAYALDHCDCDLLWLSYDYQAQFETAAPLLQRQFIAQVFDVDALSLPCLSKVVNANLVSDDRSQSDRVAIANPVGSNSFNSSSPALLMYTSGTTGQPKGAYLTQANLLHAASNVVAWHGFTAQDRVLSSLPIYHINGQVIATLSPFLSGGSIVTPHKFSASSWWSWVAQYQPTWINVVPTIIAYLLNQAAQPSDASAGQHLRFARSASAPLPVAQQRAFEARFGVNVVEAMGMTECASVIFCNPMAVKRRKIGTPGLPCGVQAKVVHPQDTAYVALAAGVQGEIVLRGGNVMAQYYKDEVKTRDALTPDGWLKTGDLGHCDADGFFFITGRLKELIIKGGENIAPREIDDVLLAHPAVLEAAAFAIDSPAYGQDIAAAVVLKPAGQGDASMDGSVEALLAHCQQQLGRFKSPSQIIFIAELPKGPSGKVQRLKLRLA
jgi:acyl-CoA synthetase (AMP-forming)/AMP-acid ligase II